jgi:1-deoxy-D-xylulose-5-phosphate reductoisomerase
MRIPIAYALSYPDRLENPLPGLNLAAAGELLFAEPDMKKFPCLRLAYEAGRLGGTAPAALNAANEEAVGAFLENKICFTDLPKVIEKVLDRQVVKQTPLWKTFCRWTDNPEHRPEAFCGR